MDEVQNETVTISKLDFDMQKLTADRLMEKQEKISTVAREVFDIVQEFQQSIRDNEIDDTTAEVFSIEDVNRLLAPLKAIGIYHELEVTREYSATVTVTLSFNVSGVKALSADEALELIESEVHNSSFEEYFDRVEGYAGDTYLEEVSVDDINPED